MRKKKANMGRPRLPHRPTRVNLTLRREHMNALRQYMALRGVEHPTTACMELVMQGVERALEANPHLPGVE